MITEQDRHDAFAGRAYASPIYTGTAFKRAGVRGHIDRAITIDGIIREFVANALLEIFPDHSYRWYIEPASLKTLAAIAQRTQFERFCFYPGGWLVLFSPICKDCLRPHTEHAGEQCLFSPTIWWEWDPPLAAARRFPRRV